MRPFRISKPTLGISLTLLMILSLSVTAGEMTTAQTAFDRLKALEGTWHGEASEGGEVLKAKHIFRISAGGSVVMETMDSGNPDHEMINMYHLDGDDLVLTHYCAGNNQPTMRLAQPLPSPNEMRFDFTGGTNFDPATDEHIHATKVVIVDDETIQSSWTGYKDGKDNGTMEIMLKRGE